MMDFNNYDLLCAVMDAVIVIEVHLSLKISSRCLSSLSFFVFLFFFLIKFYIDKNISFQGEAL